MLTSVVNLFLISAEAKGLELALSVDPGVPKFIRTDREKIAQILRNLISNAVKYTGRGSIRVNARAEPRPAGQSRLRISVSDTGGGILKEHHEAVFSSFVRLRKSVTERNVEGTGLGLTIAKRLSEIIGGTLQLESAPGEGSTFTLEVDVQKLEIDPRGAPPAEAKPIAELPPLRILLAEDNRINRIYLQIMLTEAGHEISATENGKEALELLESSGDAGFDLVLMDVQMPVMDGIEATRRIRRMSGSVSEIRIIALTAFAMKGDEERFREAGMNGYVTKPVDWAELAQIIRDLVETMS
jgi:CheY-like chemotaxis protein/anti-sigma regulatory factor (Ser/Thr protein kinase)